MTTAPDEITALTARAEAAERERDELRQRFAFLGAKQLDRLTIGHAEYTSARAAYEAVEVANLRADAAEAKLAKAMEALRGMHAAFASNSGLADSWSRARAILEEITKG